MHPPGGWAQALMWKLPPGSARMAAHADLVGIDL